MSAEGAWRRWVELCLRATIDVCRDAIVRCSMLTRLRDAYHQRADFRGGRMHRVIESLFSNPIVRITDVAKRLDVSYPTARNDLAKLADAGILEPLRGIYPKAFVARAIFNAAYSEP